MSSPIAISSSRTAAQAQNQAASAARSLDSATSTQTGLYVPVHRRNLSASSATPAPSSFFDRDSAFLSPKAASRHGHSRPQSRSPALRARSISPLPGNARHHDAPKSKPKSLKSPKTPVAPLAASPRSSADIPPVSKIPRVYALTELLALASSPSLSPSQRAQLDAHIPFMTRKSPSTKSSPSSSSSSSPSPTSSSPVTPAKPLDDQTQTQTQKKADPQQQQRRRRSGRKAPNASLKVRVPADTVEGRRRRSAYGAGWGWPAAPLDGGRTRNELGFESQSESWRAERLVAVA